MNIVVKRRKHDGLRAKGGNGKSVKVTMHIHALFTLAISKAGYFKALSKAVT